MNCPVCATPENGEAVHVSDTRLMATPNRYRFSRCQNCGSLFLNPCPPENEAGSFYPQAYWWKPDGGFILSRLESLYRSLVLRDHVNVVAGTARRCGYPLRETRLLDVGCGIGTLPARLREKGMIVSGLDTSLPAAAIAREQYGLDVVSLPLPRAGLPAQSFRMVTLFHILEHLPDPAESLREVRRILAADGRMVIQVPNLDSFQARLCGTRWVGIDAPRHMIVFSMKGMALLLDRAGFEIEHIRHFSLRDNAPALISSIFPGLDPIGRRVRRHAGILKESATAGLLRHLSYFALVLCATPLAAAEAFAGRGGTVFFVARKKI